MTARIARPADLFHFDPAHVDRRALQISLLVAVLVHVAVVLLVPLPSADPLPPPRPTSEAPAIVPLDLPTPEIQIPPSEPPSESPRLPFLEVDAPDLDPIESPDPEVDPVAFDQPPVEILWIRPEAPPGPAVYEESAPCIVAPLPLGYRPKPEYPEMARRSRSEGVVILSAVVNGEGAVVSIEVLRAPIPDLGFSESAIRAVEQWRYTPGTCSGREVSVRLTVVVQFALH